MAIFSTALPRSPHGCVRRQRSHSEGCRSVSAYEGIGLSDRHAWKLVITGDFFQLPPVTKNNEVPFFAFESEAWQKCIEHTVVLNKVFRQKDDGSVAFLSDDRRLTGVLPQRS